MNKYSKGPALSRAEGFTIIELIVVIAIIAVLAGIVLVNVTQYINKAKITAIKSDMLELKKAATIFFADPEHSGDVCDSSSFSAVSDAIEQIKSNSYGCSNLACPDNNGGNKWMAWTNLIDNSGYWCTDYTDATVLASSVTMSSCECGNQ